jgi:predicted transcriptional regulator
MTREAPISPEQCRAARGWLDWSQGELADRANVSISTVKDFEAGRRVPMANNMNAICWAFEAAGIRWTFEDRKQVGIRYSTEKWPK